MSTDTLARLEARAVALTHKSDTQGVRIKLKVFWKTTKFWTAEDIADYQKNVPGIAERLRTEQYWDKSGDIHSSTFTCEDFAIRVLCEYAASKGLPVKLTTGVRTYRNMELYSPAEHDRYASNVYGFAEMVMLTYGAPDMQRKGQNTVQIGEADQLLPGDLLVQANDIEGRVLAAKKGIKNNVGHHIQMVVSTEKERIEINQGNSTGMIHFILPKIMRVLGENPADPQSSAYAGLPIERGIYTKKNNGSWKYENLATKRLYPNKLGEFNFYRWGFYEFNR